MTRACRSILVASPWAAASIYVCDTGHQRLLVLSLQSGALRAAWSSPILPDLVSWQPEDVALTGRSEVIVADPANGGVHVFSAHGVHRRFIGKLGAVGSLAVDCADRLYVRLDGEPHVLVLDPATGLVIEKPTRPEEIAARFPVLPVRVFSGGALDVSLLCSCPPDPPLIVDAAGEPTSVAPDAPCLSRNRAPG